MHELKLLKEIINAGNLEIDQNDFRHEYYRSLAADGKVLRQIESGKFEIVLAKDPNTESFLYFLRKVGDKNILAWAQISDASILDKQFYSIDLLYVLPEYRKTRAIGLFIYALKEILDKPVILSKDASGGVLFADGLALVKHFTKEWSKFRVSLVDLESGEFSEVPDDLSDLSRNKVKGKTLIFEHSGIGFTLPNSSVNGKLLEINLFT